MNDDDEEAAAAAAAAGDAVNAKGETLGNASS
jgi:hypothetical protein